MGLQRSREMMSTAVPRSTARLRRIDLRVVIGLALLLAGVLGTVAVVQRAGQRVPVLVVAREVPAGQVVGDQDVWVAELGLAPGVATLGVGDRGRVVGRVASGPLAAGQVLTPAAVEGGPALGPGRVAMSVAVAPELGRGGVDAAQLLGQARPLSLSPVDEQPAGLPAQRSSTEDRFVLGSQQGGAASIGSFSR
jgi:hypothetical protein